MALAQQLGLQTFAWSQGIGPIRARITQQLTRSILNNCTKVSVRDNASAQLLDDWAIPYLIAPDPVWSLESFPIQQVSQIKSPKVAVNLRPSPNLTSQGLFNLTKALGDFQEATNAALIFLPFQVEQDLPLIKQVAAELSGNYHILCLDDPRNLKGVFRDVEMLIGMRYHSLVMAAAEGCRCFALSYDPKVTQLQQELNIPGWQLLELPDHPELISSTWLNEYFHGDALNYEQIQSLIERSRLHQRLFAN
jgi:polysaccharide pyruvyl transferase CsaB